MFLYDKRNILVSLIVLVLLGFVWFQSQGVEGGLDSWNHYLISKLSVKHPELFLDQWNKPVFTWLTFGVCQFGFNALIAFNIFCIVLSAWLLAQGLSKTSFKESWIIIPLLVFTPILLSNIISGLTEPLNVLILSFVFYLWMKDYTKSTLIVASFLPYVRTEGFVILAAIFFLVILQRKSKLLLYLLIGSLVMNVVGFIITKEPFWIITSNPYLKHELEGTFDPGNGPFLHFFNQARALFGLPLLLLFVMSNLTFVYLSFKNRKMDFKWLLPILVFWFYFMAHTLIFYWGILGSHGLTRVMAVIAPALVLSVFYFINTCFANFKYQKQLYLTLALIVVWVGYKETGYAKPYQLNKATVKKDESQVNFIKAGEWLIENKLMNRPIIHQSPYFNVYFDKDYLDIKNSYYVWSIDKNNDWAAKGVIVIWDGFSAVREGNMPLEWLLQNPKYKKLHFIEGHIKPTENVTQYDIHIFEKIEN